MTKAIPKTPTADTTRLDAFVSSLAEPDALRSTTGYNDDGVPVILIEVEVGGYTLDLHAYYDLHSEGVPRYIRWLSLDGYSRHALVQAGILPSALWQRTSDACSGIVDACSRIEMAIANGHVDQILSAVRPHPDVS